jgi:hypothetical protein
MVVAETAKQRDAALTGEERVGGRGRMARLLVLLALAAGVTLNLVAGFLVVWQPDLKDPLPDGLSGQALVEHLNALDSAGISALEAHALQKLGRNAMDPDALQYLGIAAGLRKDTARQETLALAAARLTLRDPRIQMTAVNIALKARKYDDALRAMDGLLRARPELLSQFVPVLSDLISSDDAVSSVARTVAQMPAWRPALMAELFKQPDGWQLAYRLANAQRQIGSEPIPGEMRQILTALIKSGAFEQAYFIWLDSLDPSALSRVRDVFDGGFELEPRNLFFDWTVAKTRNSAASVVARPGSTSDRALRIEFAGHQGFYSGVFQYLRLPPGQHVLHHEVLVQSLEASRGLVWRVSCLETGKLIAESAEIIATGPWMDVSTVFTVPAGQCDSQSLTLQTFARSGLDTKLNGVLYFDDVSVEAGPGETPSGEGN